MTIRPALSSDATLLHAMETRVFSPENYPLSRRAFYYHIRNSLLLVVESDEHFLAGYILVLLYKKHPKIYSFCIDIPYRQLGLGTMLMQHGLNLLRGNGCDSVMLEVREDNLSALKFYEKMGFTVKKSAPSFYKDGCSAKIMEYRYAIPSL
jgi:ribosomal protein S18 acetylase RimI-like enzyme